MTHKRGKGYRLVNLKNFKEYHNKLGVELVNIISILLNLLTNLLIHIMSLPHEFFSSKDL